MLATPFIALSLAVLSAALPAVALNTTAQSLAAKSSTNATKIVSGSPFADVAPTVNVNKTIIAGKDSIESNRFD